MYVINYLEKFIPKCLFHESSEFNWEKDRKGLAIAYCMWQDFEQLVEGVKWSFDH